jgi:hypothetical protein
MAKRIIHKVIWCDHGYFPFTYGFCPSEKAWDKEMRRLRVKESAYPPAMKLSQAFTTKFHNDNGGLAVIVSAADDLYKVGSVKAQGVIFHEAVHVFRALCNLIGEPNPSEEFEAYSIEHFGVQLMNGLIKSGRRLA